MKSPGPGRHNWAPLPAFSVARPSASIRCSRPGHPHARRTGRGRGCGGGRHHSKRSASPTRRALHSAFSGTRNTIRKKIPSTAHYSRRSAKRCRPMVARPRRLRASPTSGEVAPIRKRALSLVDHALISGRLAHLHAAALQQHDLVEKFHQRIDRLDGGCRGVG